MNLTIGDRLRQARKQKGLSQNTVASAIGISRGQVCKLEHDLRLVNETTLERLATVLDVTTDWLLYGHEKETAPLNIADTDDKFHIEGGRPAERRVVQVFADDAKWVAATAKEHGISQADVMHQAIMFCLKHL